MITARQYVDLLLSQDGDRYIFGAEASPSDSNPKAFDCSELVQWGADRLKVVPRMPDGSWNQVTHCRNNGTLISITTGVATLGALLFKFNGDPFGGTRPKGAHVAVSQGNGKTIEARSPTHGVGQFSAAARGWTHAALIPGITYQGGPVPPTGPNGEPNWDEVSDWAKPSWTEAHKAGLLTPSTHPKDTLTKQELIVFLDRAKVI